MKTFLSLPRFAGVFIFIAVVAFGIPNTIASSQQFLPSSPRELVDLDRAEVGDVVAQGAIGAEGICIIDQFKFNIDAPGNGETSWSVIEFDEKCQILLAAKWDGLFQDGPEHIVNPEPGLHLTSALDEIAVKREDFQIVTSGSKASSQEVFMYGGGGTSDKLTKITSSATFSWNDVYAWVSSGGETCWGNTFFSPNWWWDVDYCESTYGDGTPGDPGAWFWGYGDFACRPTWVFPCSASNPDGYFHTLNNYLSSDQYGNASCTYWYSGNIVSGVTRNIIQGCN